MVKHFDNFDLENHYKAQDYERYIWEAVSVECEYTLLATDWGSIAS